MCIRDRAFTMNINLAAGTSDRIAIAGEASGTHTVHFILSLIHI